MLDFITPSLQPTASLQAVPKKHGIAGRHNVSIMDECQPGFVAKLCKAREWIFGEKHADSIEAARASVWITSTSMDFAACGSKGSVCASSNCHAWATWAGDSSSGYTRGATAGSRVRFFLGGDSIMGPRDALTPAPFDTVEVKVGCT